MRFALIAAEQAHHSLSLLCRCLRVTRSGFYAWRGYDTRYLQVARQSRQAPARSTVLVRAGGHRRGRDSPSRPRDAVD
jgi:putative transposase